MLVEELIETAARAQDYLNADARKATILFIRSNWNRDGSVRGKNNQGSLYYTVFAAISMKALKGRIPKVRLWNYLRLFGDGASLDLVHLFSLIRLRSIFPMSRTTRERLSASLAGKGADSASDLFFKVVMAEYLREDERPGAELVVHQSVDTSDLAATVVINHRPDREAAGLLMARHADRGGFCATQARRAPDLESTAKALFALRVLGADLSPVRASCLKFIETLRSSDGGYVAHPADPEPDVENTFYALLSVGCLVAQS